MNPKPDESVQRILEMCRDTQQTLVIASRMISATYEEIAEALQQREMEIAQLRNRIQQLEATVESGPRICGPLEAEQGLLVEGSSVLPRPTHTHAEYL